MDEPIIDTMEVVTRVAFHVQDEDENRVLTVTLDFERETNEIDKILAGVRVASERMLEAVVGEMMEGLDPGLQMLYDEMTKQDTDEEEN